MTSLDLTLHLPASAIPEGAGELAIAATAHVPAEVDEQDLRCWSAGLAVLGRDYGIGLSGRDGSGTPLRASRSFQL